MSNLTEVDKYRNYIRRRQRWERFFTIAGLDWEPIKYRDFDYIITLPCVHSECSGFHVLDVNISSSGLSGKDLEDEYERLYSEAYLWTEPHPALFGEGPRNTRWDMVHGSGGGFFFRLSEWLMNADKLWEYVISHQSVTVEKETIN